MLTASAPVAAFSFCLCAVEVRLALQPQIAATPQQSTCRVLIWVEALSLLASYILSLGIAERFGLCGASKSLQDKPCGFLCDVQVFRQNGARYAIWIISYHPDCGKPYLQREFGVLENRADPDRKIDVALGTFEQGFFGKLVNLVVTAMRAVCSFAPADVLQRSDTGFFIRKRAKKIVNSVGQFGPPWLYSHSYT